MKSKFIILFCYLIFFVSCNDKDLKSDDNLLSDREAEFMIQFPALSPVDNTKGIVEFDLIVCKDNKYKYTRQAFTADEASYKALLKIEDGVDLYFFANCRSVLNAAGYLNHEDDWEEVLRPQLLLNFTEQFINDDVYLPMWGQVKGIDIMEHEINQFEVQLLRSVAAANVYFELGDNPNFELQEVYLYFGADKGYAAPAQTNLVFNGDDLTGVTVSESPVGMLTDRKREYIATSNEMVDMIYMLDNDTQQGNIQGTNQRTRLVVGGLLNGGQLLTYYPLDFVNADNTELLTVTRNNHYTITVTAVNSEGFPDPDVAAKHAAVNLEYNVISWNYQDHEDIGIDGPDYLSISSKKITLSRKGQSRKIAIAGTFSKEDMEISFDDSGHGTSTSVTGGIENDRFKAELSGEGTNLLLTITALDDYSEGNSNSQTLTLQAGRIVLTIEINQTKPKGWDNGGEEEFDF